jgi:hypothetical protein
MGLKWLVRRRTNPDSYANPHAETHTNSDSDAKPNTDSEANTNANTGARQSAQTSAHGLLAGFQQRRHMSSHQ